MSTIIINAKQWKEIHRQISLIAGFVEQQTGQQQERLPADDNTWLNGKEVCECLKISMRTLQRLRKSGDIKFSKIGNKHFYKVYDVRALMESKTVKNSSEQLEILTNSHRRLFFRKRGK